MRKITYTIFLFISVLALSSQTDSIFKLTHITVDNNNNNNNEEPSGIKLNRYWKYQKGDNIDWANSSFNDQNWKCIQTELDLDDLPKKTFENCCWFRLHIEVDTQFINKPLILMLKQMGVSELYLDGKLLQKFGKIDSTNILNDELYNPQYAPINIRFDGKRNHLLAVRYRNKNVINNAISIPVGFTIIISDLESTFNFFVTSSFYYKAAMIFYFTFFIALAILHFFLYIFYKKNISNLYYCIFALAFGLLFLFVVINGMSTNPETIYAAKHTQIYLSFIYQAALLAMLYSIFYQKILKVIWVWIFLKVIVLVSFEIGYKLNLLNTCSFLFIAIEPIRIIIVSIYKKKEGAWLIGSGVITTIIFFATFIFILSNGKADLIFNEKGPLFATYMTIMLLSTISIPLSMSAFLAFGFAKTNKDLEKKLIEVEDLSLKSIEQEKEKQHILAEQNTNLEKQVKLRTHEVVEQKKIIEEKNKDITDSISYAKRIQDATLPSKELKYKLFPEAFVLFKPKDIVSGDFYWFTEIKGTRYIAAADCTGHGVPGAMVSVVCSNALNRTVKEFGETEPGKILDKAREIVLESFSIEHNKSSDEGVKDGMDISLISIPKVISNEKNVIHWAGANNPLWYIQNNELKEITANKQPIGRIDNLLPFTTHTIGVNKGDVIYLFSDGYADQFGGPKGKKFKYKQLSDLLISIHHLPMMEQESILNKIFDDWKSNLEQIDDVLVIGVKI